MALAPSGTTRGFAFIDMSTWQDAEEAQNSCNGGRVSCHDIRVLFGMPCRPGACILQHKTSITIPFPVSRVQCWNSIVCLQTLICFYSVLVSVCAQVAGRSLSTAQKENIPIEFVTHKPPSSSMQFVLPSMTSVPYKPHPPHLNRADLSSNIVSVFFWLEHKPH